MKNYKDLDVSISTLNKKLQFFKRFSEITKGKSASEVINTMIDTDLFYYCIISTHCYGRTVKDSICNALCHFSNEESINKYKKSITSRDPEKSFF